METMSQIDLWSYYEKEWAETAATAGSVEKLVYSGPIEDSVIYPAYQELLGELEFNPDGRRILDVGSGSGRWIKFFLANYSPAEIVGVDWTSSSVELLRRWHPDHPETRVRFAKANIASLDFPVGEKFDLVNVANVLFHLVEPAMFYQALKNISRLLAKGGLAVSTEYLPPTTMRTKMMMVHNRDDFLAAITDLGMEVAATKACSFFSNDPMGIDAAESELRSMFNTVRGNTAKLLAQSDDATRPLIIETFAGVERASMAFCRHYGVPEINFPSQKLVALRMAAS